MARPARCRRLSSLRLAASGLLLGCLAAGPAAAFDVDRAQQGQPLRFFRKQVAVYLRAQPVDGLSVAKVQGALQAAMASWNAVAGVDVELVWGGLVLQPPRFDIYVAFEKDYDLSKGDVTGRTVRVHADGALSRAEIYLNDEGFTFTLGTSAAPGASTADLQGVLSHHLGHALGLGHSRDTRATMYFYGTRSTLRTLEADDQRGLRLLYPLAAVAEGGQCDACLTDADCASGRCLAWPDGSAHCALPCAEHDQCPIGTSCGSWAQGQACLPNDGHCRADAASSASGAPCASDPACGKGQFCMTGFDPGFCTAPCQSSSACAVGEQCVDSEIGGLCLPVGQAAVGEPCLVPSDCSSLRCLPSVFGGGMCSSACNPGTCPSGGGGGPLQCSPDNQCVRPGPLPVGWPCESGFDCETGQCVPHAGGKFARVCSQDCQVAGDCPAGTGCTPDGGDMVCLPFGPPVEGGPCLGAAACGSKLACDAVSLLPGVGACRTPCNPFGDDLDCPTGQRCVWAGAGTKTGGVCRGSGGGGLAGAECSATAACRVDLVCASPPGKTASCRPDCELGTDVGCASGQTCAPLEPGATTGRGACADTAAPLIAVAPAPPTVSNFAARTVNLPEVVAVADFLPGPVTTEDEGGDDGCTAGPAPGSPGWPGLLLTGLLLVMRQRRWP